MYKKIGIVACSDPLQTGAKRKMELLYATLREMNIEPVESCCLYDRGNGFAGTGQERAEALMNMYMDPEIDAICDVSGGDMANEVIPYLDFDTVAASGKLFFGYSDLTTILNAIYARTGQPSVLYQLRNLVKDDREHQIPAFRNYAHESSGELFAFPYSFIQGDRMEGVLIGGNIRCFLKLAGTGYMPDFRRKLLLLEAWGGGTAQMVTYLSQLKMLGAFEQISGIVLGTFTRMEEEMRKPDMTELVRAMVGSGMPLIKTPYIGHGADAKAAMIGQYYRFEKSQENDRSKVKIP